MSVASLGLAIDSSPVNSAVNDLDRLVAKSGQAEAAAMRLATTGDGAFRRFGSSAQGFDKIVSILERMDKSLAQVAAATTPLASKLDALGGSMGRVETGVTNLNTDLQSGAKNLLAYAQAANAAAAANANLGRTTPAPVAGGGKSPAPMPAPAPAAPSNVVPFPRANTRPAQSAGGGGLQPYEWLNLSRQASDVATMASMGASPMMILSTQAGQVYDILSGSKGGVKGALKEIGGYLVGLVTPARLAFGGIAAGAIGAGVALSSYLESQKELRASLYGVGAGSGMTVGGMNRAAGQLSGVGSGLSVSESRTALAGYAATGRIGSGMASDLTGVSRNLATTLGIDVPEANQMLAKSFSDPVKGADQLNERLGFLNDSTRRLIESLSDQGRIGEAQRTLFDAMQPSLERYAEKVNGITLAWEKLKRFGSDAYGSVGGAIGELVAPTDEQALARDSRNYALSRGQARRNFTAPGRGEAPNAQVEDDLYNRQEDARRRMLVPRFRENAVNNAREASALGNMTNRYMTDADQLKKLNSEVTRFKEAMENPVVGIDQTRIKESYDKATSAVNSFLSSDDKRRKSDELTMQSINARTAAEFSAIAAEQKRLELAGQLISETERLRQIEQARTEVLARGAREAEDRLRDSRDAAGLSGLLPYQRGEGEINNRFRRQNEKDAGNSEALRRNAAAYGLDMNAYRREQATTPLRNSLQSLEETKAANDNLVKTFGSSTAEIERVNAAQRLYNEYARAGVPVTDELRSKIEAYSQSAGKAAEATEQITKRQQNLIQGVDDLRSGTQSGITGAISAIRQGKNPLDSLQNSAGQMFDKIIDRVVSKPIMEGLFDQMGKVGGGALGGLANNLFGGTSSIIAPTATVTASVVTVVGGAGGGLSSALGATGASGVPGVDAIGKTVGGGSFGLNGAQGVMNPGVGASGLGAFGFGANGVAGAVAPTATYGGGSYGEVSAYIRQAAMARGIDPDIALRVAKSEGLTMSNPTGTTGDQGRSFGPWQLFTGGGLGNKAIEQGINVRDPNTWRAQTDFALDNASKGGWGPWYGAARVGIGKMEGIGTYRGAGYGASASNDNAPNWADAAAQFKSTTDQAEQSLSSLQSTMTNLSPTSDGLSSAFNTLGNSLSKALTSSGSGNSGGGFGGFFASLFGGGGGAPTVAAATGGHIRGPGTATSDSIPARLSDGEFVVNARSTAQHLDLLHSINRGTVQFFADGGVAGRPMRGAAPVAGMAGGAVPNVTFITPPGMSLQADGPAQRNSDGSFTQTLKSGEDGLAKRAMNGQGNLSKVAGGNRNRYARVG